ncbi:hypothetical protein [Leptospira alexanderi]|uniref:hypothetical protein n=1 Tax=Leptospira alexanderi TaxID=100053 RepID=UPI0009910D15|nr:hypothetical protein [Leptospira alexanderi]
MRYFKRRRFSPFRSKVRELIALGVFNKLSTSAPASLACANFSRKRSDAIGMTAFSGSLRILNLQISDSLHL